MIKYVHFIYLIEEFQEQIKLMKKCLNETFKMKLFKFLNNFIIPDYTYINHFQFAF